MNAVRKRVKKRGGLSWRENAELYTMLAPTVILIFIFCYIPMYGLIIAFQDYVPGRQFLSLVNANWVGFEHFTAFINSIFFSRLIWNTIRLSLLNLLFGFTIPILFALLLNEVKNLHFKKFVQTVSYLPYFISTVVVAGLVLSFLEPNGLVNNILAMFGVQPTEWIVQPKAYPTIYTVTNVWKNFGFSSVLYFSTMASIDPTLYESAKIDGANRWKQMLYITLPGLRNIIAITLILQLGALLTSNTELALLLYRSATYETSDVIGTFVYRMGIEQGKYSYSTAVGLFLSIIGFGLTFVANKVSNKFAGYGLW